MTNLIQATIEQVNPIRWILSTVRFDLEDQRMRNVLKILDAELEGGARYGTIEWILSAIEKEANVAREESCDDLADSLYRAADLLLDLLRDLHDFDNSID